MSSPESAHTSTEKTKKSFFRRHLSLVEDTPEVEQKKDLLEGSGRETLRDRDAIQTFINTRDKLMNAGVQVGEASYQASLLYDSVLETTLVHWGPEPETDSNLGQTTGLYDMAITVPKVEFSEPFKDLLEISKISEIKKAEEHYMDNGTAEGRQKKLDQIENKYKIKVQGGRTFNDRELYATYIQPEGSTEDVQKLRWSTIENRGAAVKSQMDESAEAIEASNTVRQDALTNGKTLDEAFDLGAVEYQRVMRQSVVGISEEGHREVSAIDAFNKERDEQQLKMTSMGIYARGRALHLAVSAYKETLHHLEHATHAEHSEHSEHHNPETDHTQSPTVPEAPKLSPAIRQTGSDFESANASMDTKPVATSDAEVAKPKNNDEKEKLTSNEKHKLMKKWFRKIGHDTTLALKTVNGVGTVDTIHYGIHTVTDGLSPALEKTQKILETIQSSPDNLSKEFRAAKDTIKLTVKLLKIIWEERQFEARKRKSIKYQEKLRLNSVDQVIVDARIAKIFVYLGQKHPETVLYSLYDSTPKS
jgi:hypothetical protein